MRIGVFGGTFDPPHVGHLIVAQDAWAALELDRVVFMPARTPPHKRGRVMTPADTRLAMVEAAIAGDDRFEASDLELRRTGPSYTVDTLHELRERIPPGSALFFMMGADQFRAFHTWRAPEEIARLARIAVLSRGGEEIRCGLDVPYEAVEVTRIDISATQIRERVAEGRPIRYLVPPAVQAVIEGEGLYRRSAATAP